MAKKSAPKKEAKKEAPKQNKSVAKKEAPKQASKQAPNKSVEKKEVIEKVKSQDRPSAKQLLGERPSASPAPTPTPNKSVDVKPSARELLGEDAPDSKPVKFDSQVENMISSTPKEKQGNVRLIAGALNDEGILSPNTMAYALATVEHETNGSFEPVREGYFADVPPKQPGDTGRSEALNRGYKGGENYYGRGFIQLTHQDNYDRVGKRIGVDDLGSNPDKALDPQVSAKILAAFFKDNGVASAAESGDFLGARGPINGSDKADEIANMTSSYLLKGTADPNAQPELAASTDFSKHIDFSPSQLLALNTPEMTQIYGQQSDYDVLSGNQSPADEWATAPNSTILAPDGTWEVQPTTYGNAAPNSGYFDKDHPNTENQGWGNSVVLRNTKTGEEISTNHMNSVNVKPGQIIEGGTPLGVTGHTGNSTGPHLAVTYKDAQGNPGSISSTPYSSIIEKLIPPTQKDNTPSLASAVSDNIPLPTNNIATPNKPQQIDHTDLSGALLRGEIPPENSAPTMQQTTQIQQPQQAPQAPVQNPTYYAPSQPKENVSKSYSAPSQPDQPSSPSATLPPSAVNPFTQSQLMGESAFSAIDPYSIQAQASGNTNTGGYEYEPVELLGTDMEETTNKKKVTMKDLLGF